mmetsp:Transcript_27421/g.64243  ORF Transcript_27421/g.64243 Transcript_27421/m.64243 type:complete len:322 (+) Transcript_27421:62-1027(+)
MVYEWCMIGWCDVVVFLLQCQYRFELHNTRICAGWCLTTVRLSKGRRRCDDCRIPALPDRCVGVAVAAGLPEQGRQRRRDRQDGDESGPPCRTRAAAAGAAPVVLVLVAGLARLISGAGGPPVERVGAGGTQDPVAPEGLDVAPVPALLGAQGDVDAPDAVVPQVYRQVLQPAQASGHGSRQPVARQVHPQARVVSDGVQEVRGDRSDEVVPGQIDLPDVRLAGKGREGPRQQVPSKVDLGELAGPRKFGNGPGQGVDGGTKCLEVREFFDTSGNRTGEPVEPNIHVHEGRASSDTTERFQLCGIQAQALQLRGLPDAIEA